MADRAAAPDGAHIPGEVASAAKTAPARTNKACPCPNCRPQPANGSAKAGASANGSYAVNVRSAGTGSSSAGRQQNPGSKQQQQQKRGAERKATPNFNASALPNKPLMAAEGKKKVQEAAAVKPKPKKDGIKVKLQKMAARWVKRKKE